MEHVLKKIEEKYPDLKVTSFSTFLCVAFIETQDKAIKELIQRRQSNNIHYCVWLPIPHKGLFIEKSNGEFILV